MRSNTDTSMLPQPTRRKRRKRQRSKKLSATAIASVCVSCFGVFTPTFACFGDVSETFIFCDGDSFADVTVFPENIAEYTQLTKLEVVNAAKFTGQIPSEIGLLNQLKHISLSNTGISGTIPSEIGNLSQLSVLHINYDAPGSKGNFHGTIPKQFGNLLELTSLQLRGHKALNGQLPNFIKNRKLAVLDIQNSCIPGTIPMQLGQLPQLRVINLANNQFHGTIPQSLFSLPQLFTLNLEDNQLNGKLPSSKPEGYLQNLRLGGCKLKGTISESFLPKTGESRTLSLRDNKLTGTLPSDLSNFREMNQFTGSISTSFSTSLQHLMLNDNYLNGTIPALLRNVEALQTLKLDNNDLTGSLPDNLRLTPTSQVSVYNNRLEGTIPDWVEVVQTPMQLFPNNFEGSIKRNDSVIRYCATSDCKTSFGMKAIATLSDTGEPCDTQIRCKSQRGVEQTCATNGICCALDSHPRCFECEPGTGVCLAIVGENSTTDASYVPPHSSAVENISTGLYIAEAVVLSCFVLIMILTVSMTFLNIEKITLI